MSVARPLAWAVVAALCWGCAVTGDVGDAPPASRRSGFEFMSAQTQAMQRDDSLNPAMLWLREGEALWSAKAGTANKSCADCHGDARASMRGVAARHPAWSAELSRPVDLGQRIGLCRERRQEAQPWRPEQAEALSLETYVAFQSRGLPLAAADDRRLVAWRQRGEALFRQPMGQLALSCAQCHDQRAGLHLAGNAIPEGHATGYPIYRLEWQGMGSLPRRIRGCLTGVRAEPLAWNSEEMVALALYLAQRARGMPVETPAVRP